MKGETQQEQKKENLFTVINTPSINTVPAPYAPTQKGLEAYQNDSGFYSNVPVPYAPTKKGYDLYISKQQEIYSVPAPFAPTEKGLEAYKEYETRNKITTVINDNQLEYKPLFFESQAMRLEERGAYFRSNVPKTFKLDPKGADIVNPYYALGQVGYGALQTPFFFGSIGEDIAYRGGRKTVAGVGKIVQDPLGTVQSIGIEAQYNPYAFAGSYFSFGAFTKGFGIVAKEGITRTQAFIGSAKYFPEELLVEPKVLKGEKAFPEITKRGNGKQVHEYYKDLPYTSVLGKEAVYSATDYFFTPFTKRNITVQIGRGLEKGTDVSGLYTSTKGVSTYFLRLGGEKASYSVSLLPRDLLAMPKILAVYSKPTRIPKSFRTSFKKAQAYFGKTKETISMAKKGSKGVAQRVLELKRGKEGIPYVSPAVEFGYKTEAEAVIQTGSKLQRTGLKGYLQGFAGFSKYTRIKGRTIPIYELEPAGAGSVLNFSRKSFVSYGGESSLKIQNYSVISPRNVLAFSSKTTSKSSVSKTYESITGSRITSVSSVKYDYTPSASLVSSVVEKGSYAISPKVLSYVPSTSEKYYYPQGSYDTSVSRLSKIVSITSRTPSKRYTPKGSVSIISKRINPTYLPPRPQRNRRYEYDYFVSKPVKRIKIKYQRKLKQEPILVADLSNIILPIKTDWLKAIGYGKKPRVQTIGLLPSKRKGLKQTSRLLGFNFERLF